ncbi:MAG TPA: hypothetical protein EYQ14_03300 [Gammaproteobacteria bacterium]|nr:hypothetical protein [Gammaproteobacteria bacterium]
MINREGGIQLFFILLCLLAVDVSAGLSGKEEVVGTPSVSQIYRNNVLEVKQMKVGVAIIEGVYFSKVLADQHVIRRSSSWGRLKLHAQNQILKFILKNKISSYDPIQQSLLKLYFKHQSVLNLKGGMVVEKNKIGDKAQLIYGVPLTGVTSMNPSTEDVHRKLKKLLFNGSLHNPCDYLPFSDDESKYLISKKYVC